MMHHSLTSFIDYVTNNSSAAEWMIRSDNSIIYLLFRWHWSSSRRNKRSKISFIAHSDVKLTLDEIDICEHDVQYDEAIKIETVFRSYIDGLLHNETIDLISEFKREISSKLPNG